MTVATNLFWSNAEHTTIDMMYQFSNLPAPVPFTASQNDPMEYGRNIFAAAVAGNYGPIAPYTPPQGD